MPQATGGLSQTPEFLSNREFRAGRRVAGASVVTSCLLAGSGLWIGLAGGSTSVLAAGFEFTGDVLSSTLVFAGMFLAAKPPDEDHPYGHGRIETLAALTVGVILAAGGLGICYRSLLRVSDIHPPPAAYSMAPLLGAIVIRSVMARMKFRIGRSIGSGSLVADAWNDAVDILSASVALGALGLTLYRPGEFLVADHYGGCAVGLFVIYIGVRVLRDSARDLIDTMPAAELLKTIRTCALQVPGVLGVEKCYARKTGLRHHVDLHVEVDPQITVAASHEIATHVRAQLRAEIPAVADVLVHVEPHGLGNP